MEYNRYSARSREKKIIIWQLPVKQSDLTDNDWIHPKAKYHAFMNNQSLCGRYGQSTDYFETSIEDSKLMLNKELACKKCLKINAEMGDLK